MSFIEEINEQAIPSSVINTGNTYYKAIIGQYPFTPAATIVDPTSFNCGALCNELEYANLAVAYFVDSMFIGQAGGNELDTLVSSFIDLPRQGSVETDSAYRTRFEAIVSANGWPTRTTKWAIIEALSYYADVSSIAIIEWFDTGSMNFQVRIAGASTTTNAMFLDNTYLDGGTFLGGAGIGVTTQYISDIVKHIKAAGVNYSVAVVSRSTISTTTQSYVG